MYSNGLVNNFKSRQIISRPRDCRFQFRRTNNLAYTFSRNAATLFERKKKNQWKPSNVSIANKLIWKLHSAFSNAQKNTITLDVVKISDFQHHVQCVIIILPRQRAAIADMRGVNWQRERCNFRGDANRNRSAKW